jgi:hypothetical protein
MGAFLVPVILLVIVVALGVVAVKRFSRAEVARSDRLQSPERPTLRYQVPSGQDPAAVVAALRAAGYDASPDSEPGPSSPIVIVGGKQGATPDREAVRATLVEASGTHMNPEESAEVERGPVLFEDEHPDRR